MAYARGLSPFLAQRYIMLASVAVSTLHNVLHNNGGGPEIRITTMNGDVTLRKAVATK